MLVYLVRLAAWMLLVAIAVLSSVPPPLRPITGAPHNIEHFAIFVLAGLAFGIGYPRKPVHRAAALAVFAGAVEICQILMPGRHARVSDLVVDATGASIGVLVAWLMTRATRRLHGNASLPSEHALRGR